LPKNAQASISPG